MSMKHLLTAALLVCAACDSVPPDPNNGNGELHEGNFLYSCSSDADAFCADKIDAPLPAGIALDSDFLIHFDQGHGADPTTLDADPDFFQVGANGALHAKRAGYAAVLAHAANGDVVDFVNLHVHQVSTLAIRGIDAGTGGTVFAVGDTRAVRGEPLDETNAVLAGALSLDWETSNSAVVSVTVTDADRTRGGATLRAVGPGVARIRVLSGSSTGSVDVQVGGH
jgi:hypothetical protein